MAIIYEVTLKQTYFGQSCINRFNYLGTGSPIAVIPSFALLSAMGLIDSSGSLPTGTLGGVIQDIVPSANVFVQALARTVTDENPTDFYDYSYPAGVVGQLASGQPMSPVLAYGFFTNRVRTDIARGTRRLVGVVESSVDDGGAIASATLTALNSLAALFTDTLDYTEGGESLHFSPIVVSKQLYTAPSGKPAYKYYSTQAVQQEHMAEGVVWQPYDKVRSQVSRQYKPA